MSQKQRVFDKSWEDGFAAGRFDVIRQMPSREQLAATLARVYGWEADGETDLLAADAALALFALDE